MRRTLFLIALVAGFAAATSPVWAADPGNPTFSPDPASPGQTATFAGSVPPARLVPGPCDIRGQDSSTPAYSCSYDDAGAFSGWVVVPSSATPGTSYGFVFCGPAECATFNKPLWRVTNSVGVASSPPPVSDGATVPTVHCSEFADGASLIRAHGLVVAPISFSGPIGRVAPLGGSTVASGSTVTPFPPRVPDVVGQSLAAAASLVAKACGLASTVGTGPVVHSQSPSSGVDLPRDRQVTLVLDPVPPPPPPPPPWPLILVTAGVVLLVGIVSWIAVRHARRASRTPHPPEAVEVRAGPVDRSPPPKAREWDVPEPDLVVVRYPTTYWMEEPS